MLLASIQGQAALSPHTVALQGANVTLSYADLVLNIEHARRCLHIRQTQVMALAMDNSPAWLVWDLAALASAVTLVPVPAYFSPTQKKHALADAGVDLLITDQPETWLALLPTARLVAEETLAGSHVALLQLTPAARHAYTQIAKITYTSGTTGQPKGVCLSEHAMWQVADSIRLSAELTADDRHFCVLPLATLLENVAGVYATLMAGGIVVVLPSAAVGFTGSQFDISRLHQGLLQQRATTAIMIPELLRALVASLQQGGARLPALRFLAVGGARVASALLSDAASTGLPVYEGYGWSECASVVTLNTPVAHKAGSIGKPLPHIQLKLAADGELWIRGNAFAGYTNGAALVAPVMDNEGYMPSGDLASVDAQGFWTLLGRKKNMFITSFGRNVSPEWVESELCLGASILQVCVFGEAKPWNSAVVVSQAGHDDIAAAIAACNARLPDYARITRWVLAATPFSPQNGQLTANGRLKRDAIWHAYHASIEALYVENL